MKRAHRRTLVGILESFDIRGMIKCDASNFLLEGWMEHALHPFIAYDALDHLHTLCPRKSTWDDPKTLLGHSQDLAPSSSPCFPGRAVARPERRDRKLKGPA